MFQIENLNVDVTNTFDEDVDFTISLSDLIPKYDSNKFKEDEPGKKKKNKDK